MKRRLILAAALLPLSAVAQIQVVLFDGTNETPVGAVVDLGSVAPHDTVETRFRARNIGNAPVVLTTLKIDGVGFKMAAQPSTPYTIAPGSAADFRTSFNPSDPGTYSAFLVVNTVNVLVRGVAVPTAALSVAGNNTALAAGDAIDFGSVVRGNSRTQTFTLSNPNAAAVTVSSLTVSGGGFRGPIGASTPIQLAPGQSVSFQVAFEPVTPQPAKGTLAVDQRSFALTGLGLDPPLPTASIVLGSSSGASAQQNTVSISLASASQVAGTGTLTMAFHPSVAGVTDDAAIQFLSGPRRAATVTISVGDSAAKFGSQASAAFQTGTTAGTIVFTLTLPNATQQTTLIVAPAAVNLDTVHAVRRVGDLDVSIIGFDNTYSASQLAFTFYDKNGAAMQPGVIRVDASPDFRQYFSSTTAGGSFALLATFSVQGDVNQVAAVDVQITNSAGVAKAQRVNF